MRFFRDFSQAGPPEWTATQHKAHLASKDAEIERLVQEKNELQKLNQRLSTKDAQKPEQKTEAKGQKPQKGK